MIVARQLCKSFGARRVLAHLDLTVPAGRVTLLTGDNGSGKSTLLRIVAGLTAPTSGTVSVAGHDLADAPLAALASLAFLPQSPRFHPRLTTRQVAVYHGRLRGRRPHEVDEELERWGLGQHANEITAHLSGGLRQRLAIAIFALARAPVLLLDEPGLSLDARWRSRLQAHLQAAATAGATVLVATHLLAEWRQQAAHGIVLRDGRARPASSPSDAREPVAEPASATP